MEVLRLVIIWLMELKSAHVLLEKDGVRLVVDLQIHYAKFPKKN